MSKSENRLTNIYKDLIPSTTNNQFELIGEFNEDYIEVKCNTCGEISKVETEPFLKNSVCFNSKCKRRQKSIDEIEKISKGEYTVIRNFYNTDPESKDYKKCLIRHNECGTEYPVVPRNFINGRRCPECTKTKFKTPEQYEQDFNIAGKGNFELLSKYTRATDKVRAKHIGGCNEEFDVNSSYFLRDPRCPICEKQSIAKKQES